MWKNRNSELQLMTTLQHDTASYIGRLWRRCAHARARKLTGGFLCAIILGSGCTALPDKSPLAILTKFTPLLLTEIKPQGWIYAQLKRDIRGFAGHLDELTDRANSDIFGAQKVASDKPLPDGGRTWWNGESESVWMDGFTRMACQTGDIEAMQKVDRYYANVMQHRGDDGYIGIYDRNNRYQHKGENGEFWTQAKMFIAMLGYYEATGNREILDAVKKAALLTVHNYGPLGGDRSYYQIDNPSGGTTHGLMIVEAMYRLYEITGNEQFRDFATFCYEDYNSVELPPTHGSDFQLATLLDPDKPFLGHAPHVCEHMRVPLYLYHMTGNPQFQKAYESGFRKIRDAIGVAGACKGDEQIQGLNQAIPTAGYEYCAILELSVSLQNALQMTGNAEYADMEELLVFNAAQGWRRPDGKGIVYIGSENVYHATLDRGMKGKYQYSPTHDLAAVCCNPNAGKLMPYHVSRMWMRSTNDDGLCAMLYGPCSVTTMVGNTQVTIVEDTGYPFEESISFRVTPDRDVTFPLMLRIPRWATHYEVTINNEPAQGQATDGYYTVDRRWSKGDILQISFAARVEQAQSVNGERAVKRGPLVYALRIPETATVTKSYPLEGFNDIDYNPVAGSAWEYFVASDLRSSEQYKIIRNSDADMEYPWDLAPLEIDGALLDADGRSADVSLVPVGCTILRRTCFPPWQ